MTSSWKRGEVEEWSGDEVEMDLVHLLERNHLVRYILEIQIGSGAQGWVKIICAQA